jgi:hypothetical protein
VTFSSLITRPSETVPSEIVAKASVTTQEATSFGKFMGKSDTVTFSLPGTPSDISLQNLNRIANDVREEHRLKDRIRVVHTSSEHEDMPDQVTFQAKGPRAADAITDLQKTLQARIEEANKRQSKLQRLNDILDEGTKQGRTLGPVEMAPDRPQSI